jgi:hypothetical protein
MKIMEMVIKLGINGMNGHNNYPNLDGLMSILNSIFS